MVDEYIRREDAVDLVNKISNLDLKAKGGICVSLANLEKSRCCSCGTWEMEKDWCVGACLQM